MMVDYEISQFINKKICWIQSIPVNRSIQFLILVLMHYSTIHQIKQIVVNMFIWKETPNM